MKKISFGVISATLVFSSMTVPLSIQVPAFAMPGQTLQQLDQTIRNSGLFQGMSVSDADFWAGSYSLSRPYNGGDVVLYFYAENDVVVSETLQFRYPNVSVSFERDNSRDLALIASMWGEDIAQDFGNSTYTDVIEAPNLISPNHFYRGERYGYQVATYDDQTTGGSIYSFSLMSHADWEEAKSRARFCISNPNHDDCLGI